MTEFSTEEMLSWIGYHKQLQIAIMLKLIILHRILFLFNAKNG